METLCPSVQSSGEAARDELTVGGILRAFLPLLLHLLKLGAHKLRVLWQLAACGTPALGANLFHCPHCQHRHWAPRSCGNRHCPRCLAAKSWQPRKADDHGGWRWGGGSTCKSSCGGQCAGPSLRRLFPVPTDRHECTRRAAGAHPFRAAEPDAETASRIACASGLFFPPTGVYHTAARAAECRKNREMDRQSSAKVSVR